MSGSVVTESVCTTVVCLRMSTSVLTYSLVITCILYSRGCQVWEGLQSFSAMKLSCVWFVG